MPIVGVFIFTRFVSKTLVFQKSLEDSAPFLRVPLLIFDVQSFPEETLKLPEISDSLRAIWLFCPV